ncbi:MAG: LacI family DNA-binding transcriptional regulator, partial [Halanaerobiales bacterium]
MSVKIKDIAELAEVSPGTVSKALNNKGYVADDTRQKVLKVAAELGYIHKSNKNNNEEYKKVCILFNNRMDNVIGNPFYGEVIHGVEESLSSFKYQTVFKSLSGDFKKDVLIINELKNDPMLNGILYTGYNLDDHELLMYIKQNDIPIVLIDNDKLDFGMDCIVNNDYEGAYSMISSLIELGHENIGFISGPLSHISFKKRYNGYLDALENANIKLKKSLVKIIPSDKFNIYDSAEAIENMVNNSNVQPTAIFTTNDEMAIGAMNKLIKLGYDIPGDISVAGYDGTQLGQQLIPNLSSVYVNKREMGLMAGMRLHQLINNIMLEPVKIVISVKVRLSESV